MKEFRNLEKLIIQFQRNVRTWASLSIVINLLVIGLASYINFNNSYEELTPFETCYKGMQSIVNNSPNSELLNPSIIKDTADFKLQLDFIGLIKVINSYECDVFIKSKGHTRRFAVYLEKSINFEHLYQINNIKEKKVKKEYQVL